MGTGALVVSNGLQGMSTGGVGVGTRVPGFGIVVQGWVMGSWRLVMWSQVWTLRAGGIMRILGLGTVPRGEQWGYGSRYGCLGMGSGFKQWV